MVVGERAATVAGHDHRRFKHLGELAELVPGGAEEDPPAREDQWLPSSPECPGGLLEPLRIAGSSLNGRGRDKLNVRGGLEHVGRNFDLDGTRPTILELAEGL